jgi:hypothetical protein
MVGSAGLFSMKKIAIFSYCGYGERQKFLFSLYIVKFLGEDQELLYTDCGRLR